VTSAKIDKLVHMANQISDNYATMPEREAIEGVAAHLSRFWTPKMIGELVQFADHGGPGLKPTAARAVEALKQTATSA
jgi:formate dehydrogenase subunit delta